MKTLKMFYCVVLFVSVAYILSGCDWTGTATATVNRVGTAKASVERISDSKILTACTGEATAKASSSASAGSTMDCKASVTSEECLYRTCTNGKYKCSGRSVSKTIKKGDQSCSASNSCVCVPL